MQTEDSREPDPLEVYIPGDPDVDPAGACEWFKGLLPYLRMDDPNTSYRKKLLPLSGEGDVFEDENLGVSSFSTAHKEESHGFIIRCEGKKIVYTGDIRSPERILPFVGDTDLLIIEAAHFPAWRIAAALENTQIGSLVLTHLRDERIAEPHELLIDMAPLRGRCPILTAHDGLFFSF